MNFARHLLALVAFPMVVLCDKKVFGTMSPCIHSFIHFRKLTSDLDTLVDHNILSIPSLQTNNLRIVYLLVGKYDKLLHSPWNPTTDDRPRRLPLG